MIRRAVVLLLALSPTPSLAETLFGRVVSIADGDTLTLLTLEREQVRIRLGEIDTPERRQPWGSRARQALAEAVFQKDVRVEVTDIDRYGRLIGRIWLGDRDVNRELVRDGHAWVYRQYMTDRTLLKDEEAARAARIGLWGPPDPIPPWGWRRGQRASAAYSDPSTPGEPFTCGSKRYCREMTSCDEARFYLSRCGLTRLDGDGDGIPCESICN